jgi:5'-methylthioadenosine phosphorylase
MPSELNFRANIYGMKKLGVDAIISVAAVGSFKEELEPLHMVVIDQFVDRTNQARPTTFFGDGVVTHIPFARPICGYVANLLYETGAAAGVTMHKGGTYLNMEGPAFSTKAESLLYKSWDMDVIGMTNMAEARLAREAEICYATLAMVTDYDCWHEGDEVTTVNVELVIQHVMKNAENAKTIIQNIVPKIGETRTCTCRHTLKDAMITRSSLIPNATKKKLDIIIGKYIKG